MLFMKTKGEENKKEKRRCVYVSSLSRQTQILDLNFKNLEKLKPPPASVGYINTAASFYIVRNREGPQMENGILK